VERAPDSGRIELPLEASLLRATAQSAARAIAEETEPAKAIEAAVEAIHDSIHGVMPSVFVLEHGRLWLVAQRGYPFVPDGIEIVRGVMGRAVRLGRAQFSADVRVDSDYVGALPGVVGELAVPLRAGRVVVGVLNLESERALPDDAVGLLRPLTSALVPLTEKLRASRTLDLSALARLFVYLGSLREPTEIAALAAASLSKVLEIESSGVWMWDDVGLPQQLALWRSDGSERHTPTPEEIETARALVDPSAVCQLVDAGRTRAKGRLRGRFVWLPLRTNAKELGALVASTSSRARVDADRLDTAAVLAAHVAASLDSALALVRERQSALTDSLTGILNRRGLEERLERDLESSQEQRVPLSVLVFDCDDFKEINDRAGHEFGDALLREIADVLARSLPAGAAAARLGGDEFVVVLPGAGADVAEALGARIRSVLAEGLTEAGFPLRTSAGIATYPFDGGGATSLVRAADQALYAAKDSGKDRIASFRDVARPEPALPGRTTPSSVDERRGGLGGRGDGSILAEAVAAAKAIEAEETADAVCSRLCKGLVFLVGATACLASRVVGEFLVDATGHALRDVWLGDEAAYRISDFPLTAEALRTGEPRTVSFLDGEVEPAEAFILRQLGMNALLMLPLHVAGRPWGLIELYEMRLRRFSDDDVAVAQFLASHAEARLEVVGPAAGTTHPRPRVYELPPEDARPGSPRTR
jgi:diguanylate cyclase (GGDEF)-like protein